MEDSLLDRKQTERRKGTLRISTFEDQTAWRMPAGASEVRGLHAWAFSCRYSNVSLEWFRVGHVTLLCRKYGNKEKEGSVVGKLSHGDLLERSG